MPKIAGWAEFPEGVREHLIERMRDRRITLEDLNRLRLWIESDPAVPDGIRTVAVRGGSSLPPVRKKAAHDERH